MSLVADDMGAQARDVFRRGLAEHGFLLAGTGSDAWDGDVTVAGADPARHRVRIELPPAFPFQKPSVRPLDEDPPIKGERHQEAGSDNAPLCLYRDRGFGWGPWISAHELIERIREWFSHYHRSDWPEADRPPDLHLYFPTQRARPLMMTGDDWYPADDSRSGRFAVWARNGANRAFAGHPVTGHNTPAPVCSDRLLPHLGLVGADAYRKTVGLWFRLGREPRATETLAGMLEEIDAAAEFARGFSLQEMKFLFGDRIRKKDAEAVLALGYPRGNDEDGWLFLRATLPASRKELKRWVRLTGSIAVESFEAAPAGRGSMVRRTAHTAVPLYGKRVCVFGLGAVGSVTALLLAKSGVPYLHIIDGDILRPGNSVRHVAGLGAVGAAKTHAVAAEILSHAPDCEVTADSASWNPVTLDKWVEDADVVVDATASPGFSLLLNEICVRLNRAAVFAATYRRAMVGRVQVVRPGTDACLVCRASHYAGTGDYVHIPAGNEGEFIEGGCGDPTVEASALDIEAIANVAARAAIRLLRDTQDIRNECVVVNEPLPDGTGYLATVAQHWDRWEPLAECQTCGPVQMEGNGID